MNRQQKPQSARYHQQWKRQDGMTAIGIAIILALVAFFALVVLRLFPIYMEHFSVVSHLHKVASNSATKDLDVDEIRSKLLKSFQIDDVKNVTSEQIFIEPGKNGSMVIAVEYEVRTKAMGNVDMVVSFSDEANVN